MFRNYLLVAMRQIRRHKLQSLINILGLAIGFTSCILILLYVQEELNYDEFHASSDEIYRISSHSKIGDNERHWSLVPSTVAPAVVSAIPGIRSQARITTLSKANQVVKYKDQLYDESLGKAPYGRVYQVDSTLLDLFTYEMKGLQGSKALARPKSVVLSRNAANKIFKHESPLGKTLEFVNLGTYEVTAIIEEVPSNSHFQFDYLLSFEFNPSNSRGGFYWVRSYIQLDPSTDPTKIQARLGEVGRAAQVSLKENGVHMEYFLQSIQDIHLYAGLEYELYATTDKNYIYIFLAVCVFIMVIAAINFINLSSAQLSARTRELGLRKVMGARKKQIIGMFVMQALLVCLAAFLFAIGLSLFSIDLFNAFSLRQLTLTTMLEPVWIFGSLGAILLISLVTGLYPALMVNKVGSVAAIKSQKSGDSGTHWFRKLLVVLQFTISVTLIVSTFIIVRQLHFMHNESLGFDSEQVLNIQVDGNLSDLELNRLKQTIQQYATVNSASLATGAPGVQTHVSVMRPEGFGENNTQRLDMIYADFDFIETFNIRLLSGRDFEGDRSSDSLNFIINKSAAEQFGWSNDEAIGKQMNYLQGPVTGRSGKVIAVMDDFHYQSLHHPIGPLLIGIRSTNFNVLGFQLLSVKTDPRHIESTLDQLRTNWRELSPLKPFNFSFLDQAIRGKYEQEERVATIITIFALLAIGIACLGLLGLTSFLVRQKTREIGIRKVLGASLIQVWSNLSITFLVLVTVGNIIAWPLGFYIMKNWLDDFAYRVDVPVWIFLLAGVCSCFMMLLTTGWHTIKAALANPIEAIRYE